MQKHIQWRSRRAELARTTAEEWLASDEGHALWRSEVKRLLAEAKRDAKESGGDGGKAPKMTRLELEYRARQALIKAHADRQLQEAENGTGIGGMTSSSNNDDDNNNPDYFDRAEEFLLRVWEIHESVFGRNHAGTAAACLSLGNLCVINRDLPQAKQWFKSAIAIFDHCYGSCMQVRLFPCFFVCPPLIVLVRYSDDRTPRLTHTFSFCVHALGSDLLSWRCSFFHSQ